MKLIYFNLVSELDKTLNLETLWYLERESLNIIGIWGETSWFVFQTRYLEMESLNIIGIWGETSWFVFLTRTLKIGLWSTGLRHILVKVNIVLNREVCYLKKVEKNIMSYVSYCTLWVFILIYKTSKCIINYNY